MGLAKSLRLGAVVVLILSVQLAQYQSFAKKHDEETTDTSATAPATSAPSAEVPAPAPAPEATADSSKGVTDAAASAPAAPAPSASTPSPAATTGTLDSPTDGGLPAPGALPPGALPPPGTDPGLAPGAGLIGAGGGEMQMSPEELRKKMEQEAMDEERKEINEFKTRYMANRKWRGYCLCSANMFTLAPDDSFTTICFEDLAEACFPLGFEVPLEDQIENSTFSYEMCGMLVNLEEGNISSEFLQLMDFEVKRYCKHPYRVQATTMHRFFRDILKVDRSLSDIMNEQKFDGEMFASLTESEAQYMQFPLEFYSSLMSIRDYMIHMGKTVPYSVERESLGGAKSTIEATVQVNDVYDINEKEFTFETAFTLSFAWTDYNMWSDCYAQDDEIDTGECQWVWHPEPSWKNAREIEVLKRTLFFMAGYRSAFYIMEVRGKFSTPMSFKKFPRDWQSLKVEFGLEPSLGSTTDTLYENAIFHPVSAFTTLSVDADYDLISDWKMRGVRAHEEKRVRTNEPTFLFREAQSTVWARVEEQTKRLFGESYLPAVEYESTVVVDIQVERVTSYYMLNFTLVVALLTIMSWVSFFLSPEDLNDCATLSLTIILALNVFQLIMNDFMPKTGYLTQLTQFIIASTFFAAFATIESVAVYILHRRTLLRETVINKFKARAGSVRGSLTSVLPVPQPSDSADSNDKDEEMHGNGKQPAQGHALKRIWSLDKVRAAVDGLVPDSIEEVEKVLANNLDYMCIILLPVTYAMMTIFVFDFVPS